MVHKSKLELAIQELKNQIYGYQRNIDKWTEVISKWEVEKKALEKLLKPLLVEQAKLEAEAKALLEEEE